MSEQFDPHSAAEAMRDLIVDEAPKLYAENQRLLADNARLQAAHDHQYAIAGTLLREAERVGRENDALRAAIVKCRAHTAHLSNADRALLAGLLDSITRICDAALGDAHE